MAKSRDALSLAEKYKNPATYRVHKRDSRDVVELKTVMQRKKLNIPDVSRLTKLSARTIHRWFVRGHGQHYIIYLVLQSVRTEKNLIHIQREKKK